VFKQVWKWHCGFYNYLSDMFPPPVVVILYGFGGYTLGFLIIRFLKEIF